MTNSELERLAVLMEECAEVQQVIGKIIRHGYESYNPNTEERYSNRNLLERELGDLKFAIDFLCMGGDIDYDFILDHSKNKAERVKQYLHYN